MILVKSYNGVKDKVGKGIEALSKPNGRFKDEIVSFLVFSYARNDCIYNDKISQACKTNSQVTRCI